MRVVVLLALACLLAHCAPVLDKKTLTVSGISAGGAMAVQYQVAFSTDVNAAGIVAGLPYGCSQAGGVWAAEECMGEPLTINLQTLNAALNASAVAGDVDPVSNLKQQSVMLFSGLIDSLVNHGTMELLALQYDILGVSQIVTYFNYTAEHAWITDSFGNSCTTLGSPYVNNCGLDFAGEFLRMSWKKMGLSFNEQRGALDMSHLKTFNQTYFGADGFTNSLDSIGYYYVPAACDISSNSTTTCHVHLNFHGCEQGEAVSGMGTTYVAHTGLNQWAETNNIIVVYPQVVENVLIGNENGCFDWWGYAGSNYALKSGVQMQFSRNIISHLLTYGSLPSVSN